LRLSRALVAIYTMNGSEELVGRCQIFKVDDTILSKEVELSELVAKEPPRGVYLPAPDDDVLLTKNILETSRPRRWRASSTTMGTEKNMATAKSWICPRTNINVSDRATKVKWNEDISLFKCGNFAAAVPCS